MQHNLTQGPITPTLKKMTIPVIFGMVMLMTFSLVDTFFVSLLGTEPLAAISFTFPVTFGVISLSIGLGIGTSAIIAKALGSGDTEEAKNDGMVALLVSVFLVSAVSFLGYLFLEPIFYLIGAKPTLMPMIHSYMNLWFIGCVFLVYPMVGNSILRASGDTKTPSIVMGISGLVNAILDPIFIFGYLGFPEMGIEGAALATVISWVIGFFLVNYILLKRKLIHLTKQGFYQFHTAASKMLKIGIPAAGANMLTPLAAAVFTYMVSDFGNAAVAAFGVGSRIESMASIIVLALSMTLPPFISQNFGAQQIERVEAAYKAALKFIVLFQLGIYLLLIVFSGIIIQLFSSEEAVAEVLYLFILIMPLGYGLQGVVILTNSSFNALHKPMKALVLSILRFFVFAIPFAYIGTHFFGIIGLLIGAVLGNIATATAAFYWFNTQIKDLSFTQLKETQTTI